MRPGRILDAADDTHQDTVDVPTEDATAEGGDPHQAPDTSTASTRLGERFQQRYDQVQALRAEGKGMRTIGRELSLDRKTVRRILNASSVDECWPRQAIAPHCSMTTRLICIAGGTKAAPPSRIW
jgi:hypothetical protein